jgi:hypothetical protein
MWRYRQFSVTVYIALSLFYNYSSLHTHWVLLVCCPTPVLWYRLPTADFPFPGFPKYPRAIFIPSLVSQCTLHLELPPLVSCSVWCFRNNWLSGALSDSRLDNWVSEWVEFVTDGQSARMSWRRARLWGPMTRFSFFLSFAGQLRCSSCVMGRPLWREDGSVICSEFVSSHSRWRTRNYILLSHLRPLSFLFVSSCDSQGLRWRNSNPSPHGVTPTD